MELETLRRIVGHPRIAAIKDCGGSLENTLALLADGQVAVLAGEDLQMFNAFCLGASGAIAASAHLHPQRFVALHRQVEMCIRDSTNTGSHIQDAYLERVDPQDPRRYLTPDGYRPFETRLERIAVRDGEPVSLEVRSTRHGPVISDIYEPARLPQAQRDRCLLYTSRCV